MTTARRTMAPRSQSRQPPVARSVAAGTLLLSLVLGPASARAQAPVAPPTPVGEPSPPPPPSPEQGATPPMAAPLPPPPPAGYASPPLPSAATACEPPLAPAPPSPTTSKVPSYILWGLAGTSLLVGAGFGFAALAGKADFDDNPTLARADYVHNMGVISDVGFGLGVILAVTGTVFFFADSPEGTGTQAFNHTAKRTQQRHGASVARLQMVPLVGPNVGGGLFSVQF